MELLFANFRGEDWEPGNRNATLYNLHGPSLFPVMCSYPIQPLLKSQDTLVLKVCAQTVHRVSRSSFTMRRLICSNFSCSVQYSSITQSCPTLCDPMNRSMPGLPVHHQFLESTQTHVHCVADAIQPSHPPSCPSPPALNLSQSQGLFKWVSYSHQVAKVLEFSFSISPSNEYSGLISFRMSKLDLLAVQGTPKSLLQHHISKVSIPQSSAFFMVQLAHPHISSVQSLSRVQLFATPWTTTHQASLSITNSWNLLKIVHQIGDAIQPSHPLLSSSPPAFNLFQYQGLFQWVSSSHQVAKLLEFHFQHQSFQWMFMIGFL